MVKSGKLWALMKHYD
jgi:Calpain family cysteine protease